MKMDESNWDKPLFNFLTGIFSNDDVPSIGVDTSFREIASENILDGNIKDAYNQIVEIVGNSFSNCNLPSMDFTGARFYAIPEKDGEYPVLDYILDAIKNDYLAMGKVDFNDIHDPLLFVFGKLNLEASKGKNYKNWFKLLQKVCYDHLRISCLCGTKSSFWGTKNISPIYNELMWAHYAGHHKGIAVKYTISKTEIDNVNSKRDGKFCLLSPINYSVKKLTLDEISFNDAILRKNSYWDYENEYRLVYYDCNENREYVPFPVKIEAIYLGVDFPEELICKVNKELSSFSIYRMIFDKEDVMKLRTVKLK